MKESIKDTLVLAPYCAFLLALIGHGQCNEADMREREVVAQERIADALEAAADEGAR